MKSRNTGVELYRLLLTFGICYLHAITTCGHRASEFSGRLSYLLYSCVVGFVFITGWFGIKFDILKLLRLWGVAAYATFVGATVDFAVNGFSGILRYYDVLIGNWFLNGYTVLMLAAPAVNFLVEAATGEPGHGRESARSALVLILVLVFGWAFLRAVPFLSRYVPCSAGVEDYSGLSLLGIYTAARLVRGIDLERRLSVRRRFVLAFVCVIAILCHLSSYASPFAFCLAMVGFFVFKSVRMWSCIQRAAIVLAPSTFAVFMLHANSIGFGLMSRLEDFLMDCGLGLDLTFPAAAVVTFCSALLLDLPRRCVVAGLARFGIIRT